MNTQKENRSEKSADNPLTPYNVSVAKISPGIYAIGANPAEPDVPDDRDSDLKFPRVETLLAQGVLSNRIREWEDKLIVKKIDPWQFFRAVGVKITKYDGRLIHYTGKGLEFKGSPQLVFGNFIEPFLKKGIDEWLEHIADLCLQLAKDPKPYLQTVRNSLDGCIQDVYLRMSDIDYKLRKGAAACRAAENFGKNIQREDVRDKITLMINRLNDRYKEVLDTAQADLASTQQKEAKLPAEKEQNAKATIVAIIISLLIICTFVLSVWLMPFTPFTWLKNHPNSYSLQGSIICLIPCLILGFFKPRWRNWCWGTAGIAFLGLILSLLGGRSR